jgi:hypothetical protein
MEIEVLINKVGFGNLIFILLVLIFILGLASGFWSGYLTGKAKTIKDHLGKEGVTGEALMQLSKEAYEKAKASTNEFESLHYGAVAHTYQLMAYELNKIGSNPRDIIELGKRIK